MVADLRLVGCGVRVPFAVLGDDVAGEPPVAGRVRIPASADEIGRAVTAGALTIADAESTPVATLVDLTVAEPTAEGPGWIEGRLLILGRADAGPVAPQRAARVVVVPRRPLSSADLREIVALGIDDVVLVLPNAAATPDGVPATTLQECLDRAAPGNFTRVALPISWRGNTSDEALTTAVATTLDATHLLPLRPASSRPTGQLVGYPPEYQRVDPQVGGFSPQLGVGVGVGDGDARWVEVLEKVRGATDAAAVVEDPVLAGVLPVLTRWRPPRRERGLVVFFTGLSGSGKSTLAKGLAEQLAGAGRSVTLLDGDVVRRMLSSGLGFDRAGRDLNVRRIGFVAAEVARHGGVAVCAPIAPYAESRAAVRAMVEAVGDLVLVHVATPLAECERRDTKGLYRKARAGVVTQFTGISDPYDEPLDAELRVDTAGVSPAESLAAITEYLVTGGWIPAPPPADPTTGARTPASADPTIGARTPASADPVTGG
ncbi:adenylyl-sulfate kinase [Kribbella flavida]|uniref:adenylyl-sulfate kinase n=1 Tax=Kribbella flavida TaxID=182640 RepID=UPI001ED95182|nr:adenylyl-sulfate kinase [Kribbella flavida]